MAKNKSPLQALKKQLAAQEKTAATLRKKIEQAEKENKPKLITDKVKTLADVYKIAKPTKEEWAILKYNGKSKRMLFAKHYLILALISEVLNEGHLFKMDDNEYRYYPVFDVRGSGFVFSLSDYACYDACTAVGSALSFKNEELADYAGTTFFQQYKDAITFGSEKFKMLLKK